MDEFIYTSEWRSPIGELIIGVFEDSVVMIDWKYRRQRAQIDQRIQKSLKRPMKSFEHGLVLKVKEQLEAYAAGNWVNFDFPINPIGSSFQLDVWRHLREIPFGTTLTYADLARKMGSEKLVRAVAAANGANAISIAIPCHRVIGSDGSMTGYAGGKALKRRLLNIEGALPKSPQLSLHFDSSEE